MWSACVCCHVTYAPYSYILLSGITINHHYHADYGYSTHVNCDILGVGSWELRVCVWGWKLKVDLRRARPVHLFRSYCVQYDRLKTKLSDIPYTKSAYSLNPETTSPWYDHNRCVLIDGLNNEAFCVVNKLITKIKVVVIEQKLGQIEEFRNEFLNVSHVVFSGREPGVFDAVKHTIGKVKVTTLSINETNNHSQSLN